MSEQSLWKRTLAAIHHEYDRRIRRASLVTEYGAAHGHHADQSAHASPEHDDDLAEIVNVPKGTPIGRHVTPDPASEQTRPTAE